MVFKDVLTNFFDMGVKHDDEILSLWLFSTRLDSWETFGVSLTNAYLKEIVTMEVGTW